jgi:hypothetical protein
MRTSPDAARARAEALFKPLERPKTGTSSALEEYQAAQRAAFDRMAELRALRLAREAQRSQAS